MSIWKIPFVPMGEPRQLFINIYNSDGSDEVVMLKGGATPFTLDMEDSNDFLTPVRSSTGYISVIDEDGTLLHQIIPTRENSRLVRLVHESKEWIEDEEHDDGGFWNVSQEILWQGYVQANNFGNRWAPGPQEIKIPVIDCLGALQNVDMPIYTDLKTINDYLYAMTLKVGLSNICYIGRFTDWDSEDIRKQDLLNAVLPENWYTWNDDQKKFDSVPWMDVMTDICTYMGLSVMQKGDKLFFLSPDRIQKDNMRKVALGNSLPSYLYQPEYVDVLTEELTDYFEVVSANGRTGWEPGAKSIEVTADLNRNNDEIFATNWSSNTHDPLGNYASPNFRKNPIVERFFREMSFKNNDEITCYQYINNQRQSGEHDIISYNATSNGGLHPFYDDTDYARMMYGANAVAYNVINTNDGKRHYEEYNDFSARLLLSSASWSQYSNQLAAHIKTRNTFSIGPKDSIKISGGIKILRDNWWFDESQQNDVFWREPSEEGINLQDSYIAITIKVGNTSVYSGRLTFNDDGTIKFVGNFDDPSWRNYWDNADGLIIQYNDSVGLGGYVSGPVQIDISTPRILWDGSYGNVRTAAYVMLDMKVEVVHPMDSDWKGYKYEDQHIYKEDIDTLQEDEKTISTRIATPDDTNRLDNGLGILRYRSGMPHAYNGDDKPEQILINRCKQWYADGHEVLEVDVRIREFEPFHRFTYHGRTYYLLAVSYNWRNNSMRLKLIDSNKHLQQ